MIKLKKRLIKFKNVRQTKPKTQLKKARIMKDVDELYEKYYDAFRGKYDNSDELNRAENKKFDYKQFRIFNKTDKESKLNE